MSLLSRKSAPRTVADLIVATLHNAGVQRIWGVTGDSLNGLNDSLLGVGLVITLFQLPMSTFIMRNAFDAIPKDMEEAAMVDGCNSLQALFKILVPVVKPSMVTVGLLAFLEAWNNFMIPLYLSSSSKSTLPLAMVNMRQQTMGVIDYGATEAGVVILLIPCAILFLALQKYYVKGFMAGAVKG